MSCKPGLRTAYHDVEVLSGIYPASCRRPRPAYGEVTQHLMGKCGIPRDLIAEQFQSHNLMKYNESVGIGSYLIQA
jgi:hypothetical protein